MIEDKLKPEERRRLECLAQAIQYGAINNRGIPTSPEQTIATAKEFEKYVGQS